jgi:hypothetical protein
MKKILHFVGKMLLQLITFYYICINKIYKTLYIKTFNFMKNLVKTVIAYVLNFIVFAKYAEYRYFRINLKIWRLLWFILFIIAMFVTSRMMVHVSNLINHTI